MSPKRSAQWSRGSVFLVPLSDGSFVVGQVLGQERRAMNAVGCVFTSHRLTAPALPSEVDLTLRSAIAILLTTPECLKSGSWRVVGHSEPAIPPSAVPYEMFRARDWIGATIIGAGIVESFLDAYFALAPWDDWADSNYLDGLLLSPDKKPATLKYK